MNETKIEITNVGGLEGKHTFTLKRGLNSIKAGNAIGKTSFQKAIELLGATNYDLKGAKHYANLFGNGIAEIKLSGDINCSRKFRINGNDLLEAGGDPIIKTGRGYISHICFATPENPVITKLLEGQSIKPFIERFSDSEYYDTGITLLENLNKTLSIKLATYREILAKIDEKKKTIELLKQDKIKLEQELSKLPEVDKQKAMKDEKSFLKAQKEQMILRDKLSEVKANLNETNNAIEDLTHEINALKVELETLEKKYPKLEKRLTKLATEIPDTQDIVDKQERIIQQLEEKLNLALENKTSRTKFSNGNVCYACGKPLTLQEIQKYISNIELQLDTARKAKKQVERVLEDLEEEKRELEDTAEQIGVKKDRLEEKTRTLSTNERVSIKLETEIENLKKELKKIGEKIKQMSKDADEFRKYQERDRIETLILEKEKSIKQAEERLETLQKQVIDYKNLQNKKDFLESAIKHMKIRREEIVDVIRVKFNKIINKMYQNMGFKNIEEIYITRDYTITVTKKDGGKEVENFPLEALSASERVTLGVALLMVAKQEYLPEFPFFVLDEIVTSYDPQRFEKIKEFVKKVTDYVIVTQVSDEKGIVIEHGA